MVSGVKRDFACTFTRHLSACGRYPAVTVTLETGGAGTDTQRAIPGSDPALGFLHFPFFAASPLACLSAAAANSLAKIVPPICRTCCDGRDTGCVGGEPIDFFISHAGADRAWAEWVAWQLEAGYTVELDVWDWAPGRNFVTAMSDALERCARVVALFSAAYFDRTRYTTEEWSAAVLQCRAGRPPGAGAGGGRARLRRCPRCCGR